MCINVVISTFIQTLHTTRAKRMTKVYLVKWVSSSSSYTTHTIVLRLELGIKYVQKDKVELFHHFMAKL